MGSLIETYMPEGASTVAAEVDALFMFIHWLSVLFFVLIVFLMIYFVIRYKRRSEDDTTPNITHNSPLEIAWSVIPLILVAIVFFWGFKSYVNLRVPPENSMDVYVTAEQWRWQFEYLDGTISPSELVVPVDVPVKLTMSSQDVLHSLYVPSFRVKQDVLPNRYTTLWFEATRTGDFDLFCTEYCGTSHSEMIGKVIVKSAEDFEEWRRTGGIDPNAPLEEVGRAMFSKLACVTCHTVDGTAKVGPTFRGLFGKTETLADGSTVTVDENYIRESILTPNAKIVQGFPAGQMPTYASTIKDERTINGLIEYIKTLQQQ